MGQWFRTNLWGLIAGFVAGGLLVGTVLSSAADSLYGSSAQVKQSIAASSASIDSGFPAAQNQDQLVLFRASKKACDAINSVGARFDFTDGSTALVGPSKDPSGTTTLAFATYSSSGDLRSSGLFADAPPMPCLPADLNQQVLRGSDNLAVEFLVEPSAAGTYMWHSHRGGDSLSNIYLTVNAGTISGYSDLGQSGNADSTTSNITYGLSGEDLSRLVSAQK